MREELTATLEELKKARPQASISLMSKGDDIERGYTDPISSLVLTTSLDFDPKAMMAANPELPQETKEPTFRTNIGQPVFDTPSPTPTTTATND